MTDTRPDLEPRPRRWAWRIGSLAGVSIYLHATFLLLLAWIAVSHVGSGHGLVMAAQGLLLIASVFADGSAIAVFQHDQLVGLLDPAHIDQLLAMRGMTPRGLA